MFVYNNSTRLVALGKLRFLPGETELDKKQAKYLLDNFDIKKCSLLRGKNPVLLISKDKIEQTEEADDRKGLDADAALRAFTEGNPGLADMSNGQAPSEEKSGEAITASPSVGASLADRIKNGG